MDAVLLRFMKDEFKEDVIQAEIQEAVDDAMIKIIRNFMRNKEVDAMTAMDTLGISPDDQVRYQSRI